MIIETKRTPQEKEKEVKYMMKREELRKAYREAKEMQYKFEELEETATEDYNKRIQHSRVEALRDLANAIDKVLWEVYDDPNE